VLQSHSPTGISEPFPKVLRTLLATRPLTGKAKKKL
jgi:hypothetical protein